MGPQLILQDKEVRRRIRGDATRFLQGEETREGNEDVRRAGKGYSRGTADMEAYMADIRTEFREANAS